MYEGEYVSSKRAVETGVAHVDERAPKKPCMALKCEPTYLYYLVA